MEIVARLEQAAEEHRDWIKEIVVLYFGDYDFHGEHIRQNLEHALNHFSMIGEIPVPVEVRLIAVTPEQVGELGLVGSQLEAFMTTKERLEQFCELVVDAVNECWDESIYDEHTPPEDYDYEAAGEEEPESIDVDNEYHKNTNRTIREEMAKLGTDAFKKGWIINATLRRQKELEEEEKTNSEQSKP